MCLTNLLDSLAFSSLYKAAQFLSGECSCLSLPPSNTAISAEQGEFWFILISAPDGLSSLAYWITLTSVILSSHLDLSCLCLPILLISPLFMGPQGKFRNSAHHRYIPCWICPTYFVSMFVCLF